MIINEINRDYNAHYITIITQWHTPFTLQGVRNMDLYRNSWRVPLILHPMYEGINLVFPLITYFVFGQSYSLKIIELWQ